MILFFGPAGSGKSTQAQMLVDDSGWSWLSMGQLLRETTDPEVSEFQKKGILVPFEKTNQVLSESLDKFTASDKVILDGYPREIEQARWLIKHCELLSIPIDLAVHFDVNLEELLKRMELRGRFDDTPESINKRLEIYHQQIDPILNFLEENGTKIIHVDGVGTVEEIHERAKEEIDRCELA